jgi:TolB-like protein/DNA-binding winged helix-turn-helix (wHTH) protein/Tfp pilus assembly protein PilF
MQTTRASNAVRFGPFKLDLRSGELHKHGRKICLQEQPFRLLTVLVERPGDVVTREELRDRLWPNDTTVEFGHSINSAVKRLRDVLGDTADKPKYVETVARRGYRFLPPVEWEEFRPTQPITSVVEPPVGPTGSSAAASALEPVIPPALPKERLFSKKRLIQLLVVLASGALLTGLALELRRSHWFGRPAPGRITSLAVLPMENLSGDTGQEYFADGMTAELITELAKIGSLHVISRTSAMRYKRTRKPLVEIARELKVDALVEGEVLRTERRVRITAQLIEAATDRHLWAETYERDLRDAVQLQAEVAESIASAIRTKVTPEEHARLSGNRRIDPEAYEAYLKGRYFWNQRTESGLKKSIEYFQWAIEKDPGNALAYTGLADSYRSLVGGEMFPPREGYLKASAAGSKALGLNEKIGEAHTVLADAMYQMNWDWRGAEREFKRAIEVSPGYATAHQRYSLFLMKMGRSGESLAEIHRAQALDPLSLGINSSVGWRLLSALRYDDAIDQLQKTLKMDPNFRRAHLYLGWAYEAKRDFEKATIELRKSAALSGACPGDLASLAHAYALSGHAREAERILNDLEKGSRRARVPSYNVAIVYAGLGNKDRAFESLAKSCRDREVGLVSLKADLELDNLHSDPRFKDLLRCAGLAQ